MRVDVLNKELKKLPRLGGTLVGFINPLAGNALVIARCFQ